MRYEPMFDEFAAAAMTGSIATSWAQGRRRTRPDGTPAEPLGRIDWFFARGLVCSDPAVVPAVDEKGVAISDHEALAVTVRPVRA